MQPHYARVAGGSMNQTAIPNRRRTDFPRDRRSADVVLIAWPANRPDRRVYRPLPATHRFAHGALAAHEPRWDRRAGQVATTTDADAAPASSASRFASIQASVLILLQSVAGVGQCPNDDVQYATASADAAEDRWKIAAWKDDSHGVTSLEYGLLAALITIVVIAGFSLLDTRISTTLSTISAALPSG